MRHHRHLTESQRSMVVAKLSHGGDRISEQAASLPIAPTQAQAAEMLNVAELTANLCKILPKLSAVRIARAKKAHDDIIGAVYRAQADALLIEARAKSKLADEYDAAQERGEVAGVGQRRNVVGDNVSTAADLGLRRDEIHEAQSRVCPAVVVRRAELVPTKKH